MNDDVRLRRIRGHVETLESDDAFARREAIEALVNLTQRTFGFGWTAEAPERARSVRRWKRWLLAETNRLRRESVQNALSLLATPSPDPAALHKALEVLPESEKNAFLSKFLEAVTGTPSHPKTLLSGGSAKQAARRPLCQGCARRPATVRLTLLQTGGDYASRMLCEVCAQP